MNKVLLLSVTGIFCSAMSCHYGIVQNTTMDTVPVTVYGKKEGKLIKIDSLTFLPAGDTSTGEGSIAMAISLQERNSLLSRYDSILLYSQTKGTKAFATKDLMTKRQYFP